MEPVWLGGKLQNRTVKYDERAHAYYIVVGRGWLEVEPGTDNTWATTGEVVSSAELI